MALTTRPPSGCVGRSSGIVALLGVFGVILLFALAGKRPGRGTYIAIAFVAATATLYEYLSS